MLFSSLPRAAGTAENCPQLWLCILSVSAPIRISKQSGVFDHAQLHLHSVKQQSHPRRRVKLFSSLPRGPIYWSTRTRIAQHFHEFFFLAPLRNKIYQNFRTDKSYWPREPREPPSEKNSCCLAPYPTGWRYGRKSSTT